MKRFHLTARPRYAIGRRYVADAYTIEGTAHLFAAMRREFPDYPITIENRADGFVHTFRASESFSAAVLEQ